MGLPPRRISPQYWEPVGITELEPNALTVIRSNQHHCVIASPGAGKTEMLAQRAAFLLQAGTCPRPQRILAISFKRDAARNLSERVAQRCHREHSTRLDSMTFDAFAKSLVDRFGQALPSMWRPTPDYSIKGSYSKMEIEGFLRTASTQKDRVGTIEEIRGIMPTTFERFNVLYEPLPEYGRIALAPDQWAGDLFWHHCLHSGEKSELTFAMLGRLAELILRLNQAARTAIALTYSHVFLDEFQDVTQTQYDLVRQAFARTATVLTAVGDHKQQIMRWALAMEDPFAAFERDFACARTRLYENYRSSPQLVYVQHVLAQALDQESTCPQANVPSMVHDSSCMIWEFSSQVVEAYVLSNFVRQNIQEGLRPNDIVLLVKQKADDYAAILQSAFDLQEVPLRNEAAKVGHLSLQELVTEVLSEITVLLLRIASTRTAGATWNKAVHRLKLLRLTSAKSDDTSDELGDVLDSFTRHLAREWFDPPQTEAKAQALVSTIIAFLGREKLVASNPAYAQGDWLSKVEESVSKHLWQSSRPAPWAVVLDIYEGINAVSLMTVHKSKGLEYHTVILVGFDDQAWWSYRKDPKEAMSTFFVAFTRAKQRVVLSHCRNYGKATIARFYRLLQNAGIEPAPMG